MASRCYGPEFFPNTSNSMIINPRITISNQHPNPLERFGLRDLLKNITEGAFHDAAERGDPPRCHPHTREAIRAEIMEWIKSPRPMRKLILWMYGPAGSGKTAIAQSMAEECERLGVLAASFFFWRTAIGRNDTSRFVATIAYQLSRFLLPMQEHLFAAIERDPTIFSRSLSTQMRVLVIEPLKLAELSFPLPIFTIVDGIDECGPNGRSQLELLHLLGSAVTELQDFPLIFLVASRPEYNIREAFNGNSLNALTKVLVLDNSYKPDKDIKLYFDSTFRDIYEKHHRLGRRLPSPWPIPSDIHSLVSKASGQFIFAATVTKFIDSPRHNPADRMNIILRLSANGQETPFAMLDELYRFILDSVADLDKVLDILAYLSLGPLNYINNLEEVEELLGIEFRGALVDMHSLVHVPPPTDNDAWTTSRLPSIYHASLWDFLTDRSRSRQYYVGISEGHLRIVLCCLKAIEDCRHFQYLSVAQALDCIVNHAEKSPVSEDLVNNLARLDLRALLERSCDVRGVLHYAKWKNFFECAKLILAGSNRLDVFLRLQNEFDTFILDRITQYPPSLRTHVPALLLCLHFPTLRIIFKMLAHSASNSAVEYNKFLNLDRELLGLDAIWDVSIKTDVFSGLFRNKIRSGQYFVDGESYAALAKAIVSVICASERNYRIRFDEIASKIHQHLEDGWHSATRMGLIPKGLIPIGVFFPDILELASMDRDLANSLLEHFVQFRNDIDPIQGRKRIAEASIKYLQRCGIPFMEHLHHPGINECAICIMCVGATVVEDLEDVTNDLLSAPFPNNYSLAHYPTSGLPHKPDSRPFFYHNVFS